MEDTEHKKVTRCKKCNRTRKCRFFPIVVALVTEQTAVTSPIGGTGHETTVTTYYQKTGSTGAYLCSLCQVKSWIVRWFPLFLGGFLPALLTLLAVFNSSYRDCMGRHFDIFWVRFIPMFVLVFGGILALPFFFLYFAAFKGGSYEEVETLLAREVKKNMVDEILKPSAV